MPTNPGDDKGSLPTRSPALEKLMGQRGGTAPTREIDSTSSTDEPGDIGSNGVPGTPGSNTATPADFAPADQQLDSGKRADFVPGDQTINTSSSKDPQAVSLAWELENLRIKLNLNEQELGRLRGVDRSHQRLLRLLEENAGALVAGDPRQLPTRILEIGLQLVGAERAAFFRLSDKGALRTSHVMPTGAAFNAISRSIVRDALMEKRTVVHQGRSTWEGEERQSIIDLDLETVVATPLLARQRLLGVLYLDGSMAGKFTGADLPVLEVFSQLAAAAILRLEELQQARAEKRELKEENLELRKVLGEKTSFGNILVASEPMKLVIDQLRRMCRYRATVRIMGETGTGKELIARALHSESSWSDQPFVAINCGAIPEPLLEAELFGHVKGAFTGADQSRVGLFEKANGGTLFLDEIGDMPVSLQVKLLRVLESNEIRPVGSSDVKSVDVRIIAASHANLEERVSEGNFREDLFYRLNVLSIRIPPLRERVEDVEMLASFFATEYAGKMAQDCPRLTADAVTLLQAQLWPGNVRQLEKCIERSLALRDGEGPLTAAQLILDQGPNPGPVGELVEPSSVEESLKQFVMRLERAKIESVLALCGGRVTTAAIKLGISRQYLHRKLKDLGLR